MNYKFTQDPKGTQHNYSALISSQWRILTYTVISVPMPEKGTPQTEEPVVYLKAASKLAEQFQAFVSLPLSDFILQFRPEKESDIFWEEKRGIEK